MKKLLSVISVLAVAMTSCEKGDKPVSTESKFIGTWDAQIIEDSYEYGVLNTEDTTIRIVEELEFEYCSVGPGYLILDFTSDSLFCYSEFIFMHDSSVQFYDCTYSDDTLYYSSKPYEMQIETVSDTSLVLIYKKYESYNDGDTIEYYEYKQTIYFEKIHSEDSGCHAAGRHIKGDKASFFQGLKKKRNRKR